MKILSEYLKLGNKLDLEGVFDPILDLDANYFINIKRLRVTTEKEFDQSYKKINDFFGNIALLLAKSKDKGDRLYKSALKKFPSGEVNGIGLGYSKGTHGSGLGIKTVEKIISDAKQIIDSGVCEPEIFHLVGLFEEKVGPDRLSDMFATIIEDDIKSYTLKVNRKLGINSANYPDLPFDGEYLINPYKGNNILLLPKDILHEIPIAADWEDIDRVCQEIEIIRNEVNEFIGQEWKRLTTAAKKDFIRQNIMNDPQKLTSLINTYKGVSIDKYDFDSDELGEYKVPRYSKVIAEENPLKIPQEKKDSFEIASIICSKFKDLVENNKLYDLLYTDDGKPRKEKIAQLAFLSIAEVYCETNNIDLNQEVNSGRGPVDFKLSNGYDDRTLIEIKLTTNPNLLHGFNTQIQEYSKAEKTNKLIYLVIDNGGSKKKVDELKKIYKENQEIRNKPLLIIVDARPKNSASKFK